MEELPSGVEESLGFERQNWAQGSVLDDPFYDTPHEAPHSRPGTLLRLERNVDTSKHMLPPTTTLSRFIY
jgi:hypothetical protein